MRIFSTCIASVAAIAMLVSPLTASASLLPLPGSFGGKIIRTSPCISPLGPSLLITVRSAGADDFGLPKNYILTPGTIIETPTILPLPGGQALGTADIPYTCWTLTSSVFLFFSFASLITSAGQRVTMVGFSTPSISSAIPSV